MMIVLGTTQVLRSISWERDFALKKDVNILSKDLRYKRRVFFNIFQHVHQFSVETRKWVFRGVSSNHFSWVSRGCHVVFVIPPSPYYDRTGEVQSLTFPVIEMFVFFPEMKGTCQSGWAPVWDPESWHLRGKSWKQKPCAMKTSADADRYVINNMACGRSEEEQQSAWCQWVMQGSNVEWFHSVPPQDGHSVRAIWSFRRMWVTPFFFPGKLTRPPEKKMLGSRLFSYWNSPFLGDLGE